LIGNAAAKMKPAEAIWNLGRKAEAIWNLGREAEAQA
jgi:hypothetical protein